MERLHTQWKGKGDQEQGLSLASVLIGLALSTMATLGFVRQYENQSLLSKKLDLQAEVDMTRGLLAARVSCEQTLAMNTCTNPGDPIRLVTTGNQSGTPEFMTESLETLGDLKDSSRMGNLWVKATCESDHIAVSAALTKSDGDFFVSQKTGQQYDFSHSAMQLFDQKHGFCSKTMSGGGGSTFISNPEKILLESDVEQVKQGGGGGPGGTVFGSSLFTSASDTIFVFFSADAFLSSGGARCKIAMDIRDETGAILHGHLELTHLYAANSASASSQPEFQMFSPNVTYFLNVPKNVPLLFELKIYHLHGGDTDAHCRLGPHVLKLQETN